MAAAAATVASRRAAGFRGLRGIGLVLLLVVEVIVVAAVVVLPRGWFDLPPLFPLTSANTTEQPGTGQSQPNCILRHPPQLGFFSSHFTCRRRHVRQPMHT